MPIWSYVYLLTILVGSCYLIRTVKPKSALRFAAEILSFLSCVTIFVISYNVLNVSHPLLVNTILLIYIFSWGYWGYKEFYIFYRQSASEFAKTVELGKNETFEEAVLSIKIIKSCSIILVVAIVTPLLYVYFKVL